MLVRIKPKPQPSKRFRRRNVDSVWQGDTFQFRISGTGKVYVTGFTDDRSRYRVISKAYLHKSRDEAIDSLRHALKKGRIPKQIYLDNARQFTAKEFREELAKHNIRPVYGRPYHPRGRGKIERYQDTVPGDDNTDLHHCLILEQNSESLTVDTITGGNNRFTDGRRLHQYTVTGDTLARTNLTNKKCATNPCTLLCH